MSNRRRLRLHRRSGVLLPISALPGPDGIGDLGPAAYRFVDWLHRAGQRAWQILPFGIPDSTGSPYASPSSEAGNWLFISPELLRRQKLLPIQWPERHMAERSVSYRRVFRTKWTLVRASYRFFLHRGSPAQQTAFARFRRAQGRWLENFILFQALKDRHGQRSWWTWESKWRHPRTARLYLDRHLRRQMDFHAYAQWLWTEQWQALRRYAHQRRIAVIGDLPFFVRADSVDVWAHPELFRLDRHGQPAVVAGVPPDAFARHGQRWGNPLYDWPAHRRTGFRWWVERFRLLDDRCDVIRVDHFRGLVHTWQIPARAATARRGRWVPSPGRELLRAVKRHVPRLNLIAEDLGSEETGADGLRRAFHLPTIRVMLFGWNGLPDNPHHPQAITEDVVYYTANHDTNTTVGGWREEAKRYERRNLRLYLGPIRDVAWQCLEAAAKTSARLVMMPIQDILRLGLSARLNRPGRQRGNWSWRLSERQLTARLADRLARLVKQYGR